MIIFLKNKYTLVVDDFYFKCCVGKNGVTTKKVEGDKKTPSGFFKIEHLYYRKDRINLPKLGLRCIKITKKMTWCDDQNYPDKYNRLININNKVGHEKLFRKDHKYDLLIPIKFNFEKRVPGHGSCIFIHLTKDYQPTAGCIALNKKDFLIMLKLINKKTQIKIF
jgi:L,D-peptidoglycan transpeptidase YkuD (ErfK/YbiS/YcfS/YnhG family)